MKSQADVRRYHEWKAALTTAREQSQRQPSSVAAATEYWALCNGYDDLRSVERAMDAFASCARNSPSGLEALSAALFEVFELTGSLPTSAQIGSELEAKLSNASVSEPCSDVILWLRNTLDAGNG